MMQAKGLEGEGSRTGQWVQNLVFNEFENERQVNVILHVNKEHLRKYFPL